MIDAYLATDWDEAPESMEFASSFGEILDDCLRFADLLSARDPARPSAEAVREAVALFVRAPALVNVVLNYKICVEHGLPLHPTVYYELAEAKRYAIARPIGEVELANRLYRESIEAARAAVRLDPAFPTLAARLRSRLPPELAAFVYTGGRDKYTWRGSEPAKLSDLARKVLASWEPDMVVAAAHGSIMPGLLFAEYLGKPLYFVRFSMFKRSDEAPIVSFSDESWLSTWRGGRALLFDEDVARGTTLGLFAARLSPLFRETRTACAIRHAGSGFRPDFAARTWWD